MTFVTAFDLDLTLIDSRPAIIHSLRAVAESVGEPVVPGRFEAGVRGRLETTLSEWYPGHDADALGDVYRSVYSREAMRLVTLLPGAADALEAARSFGRVLVITGKYEPTARLHLEQLHCAVDGVVGWRHGPAKTNTMLELGVDVYVGDQIEDVRAALAANVVAVAVATGLDDRFALAASGADHVLDSLAEFAGLLPRLVASRA